MHMLLPPLRRCRFELLLFIFTPAIDGDAAALFSPPDAMPFSFDYAAAMMLMLSPPRRFRRLLLITLMPDALARDADVATCCC